MKRPLGVSVLAAFWFVAVVLQAVQLLAVTLDGPFWGAVSHYLGAAVRPTSVWIGLRVIVLIFQAWAAWALWSLQHWVRMFVIAAAAIGLAWITLGIVITLNARHRMMTFPSVMPTMIRALVEIALIVYFLTPSVKQAFAPTEPTLW